MPLGRGALNVVYKTMGSKKDKKMVQPKTKGYKQAKMEKVMHEFKEGKLHSGSKKGKKVTSRKQAIAIAISEAKRGKKKA